MTEVCVTCAHLTRAPLRIGDKFIVAHDAAENKSDSYILPRFYSLHLSYLEISEAEPPLLVLGY
jgi:hypothetical protein